MAIKSRLDYFSRETSAAAGLPEFKYGAMKQDNAISGPTGKIRRRGWNLSAACDPKWKRKRALLRLSLYTKDGRNATARKKMAFYHPRVEACADAAFSPQYAANSCRPRSCLFDELGVECELASKTASFLCLGMPRRRDLVLQPSRLLSFTRTATM